MKHLIFCSLLLLLVGCAQSPEAPPATTVATRRGAPLAELEHGRQVFVTRCIECHSLPAIREHSRTGWPKIVHWMAPRAGLTPDEQQALLAYVLAVHDAR